MARYTESAFLLCRNVGTILAVSSWLPQLKPIRYRMLSAPQVLYARLTLIAGPCLLTELRSLFACPVSLLTVLCSAVCRPGRVCSLRCTSCARRRLPWSPAADHPAIPGTDTLRQPGQWGRPGGGAGRTLCRASWTAPAPAATGAPPTRGRRWRRPDRTQPPADRDLASRGDTGPVPDLSPDTARRRIRPPLSGRAGRWTDPC